MSIIIFILILLILVLAHEWGHFIVAKKSGIRVDEFGFGFPPRAMKLFKKGETLYTLNWLPIGGFVKIFGENGDDLPADATALPAGENTNGPERSRSFVHKPKYIQAAVLLAGVFMNFMVAWALFSVGFISGTPVSVTEADRANPSITYIGLAAIDVAQGKSAAEAGVQAGDIIAMLQSGSDELAEPSIEAFKDFIAGHENKDVTLSIIRDEQLIQAIVQPREDEALGRATIGVAIDTIGREKLSLFPALGRGFTTTIYNAKEIFSFLGNLIRDSFLGRPDISSVSGPVGIVSIVGQAAELGASYLVTLIAVISVNLAVINLMPFPALDGGRLLFLLVEAVIGRKLPSKATNIVNTIGFGLLILLMIGITYQDIVRLIAA